ncbi:MAG: hypothetical protein ACRC5M_04975 [Anaeroplasmataceae bacterium]
MNMLEIFGLLFIAELFLMVVITVSSILIGHLDRHQKKVTYKEMLKYESQLSSKVPVSQPPKSCDTEQEDVNEEEPIVENNERFEELICKALNEKKESGK